MNAPPDPTAVDSADAADNAGAPRLMLDVYDLRAGYGRVPVLHGVTFQLHEGEALGIVGHNGMGKTTLLKTIVGLLTSTGGRVALEEADVTRWPAHARSRRGLAYVPQGRGICRDCLRSIICVSHGPAMGRRPSRKPVERVVSLFPRLAPLLDRRGGALSGG
jgi:ABC-type branched-subunit amino acid transport system ATPase component